MTVYQQNKLALSPYEDKRYYLNKVDSVAYGHYMCNNRGGDSNSTLAPEAAMDNRKDFYIPFLYVDNNDNNNNNNNNIYKLYIYIYIYIYYY